MVRPKLDLVIKYGWRRDPRAGGLDRAANLPGCPSIHDMYTCSGCRRVKTLRRTRSDPGQTGPLGAEPAGAAGGTAPRSPGETGRLVVPARPPLITGGGPPYKLKDYLPEGALRAFPPESIAYMAIDFPNMDEELTQCMVQNLSLAVLNQSLLQLEVVGEPYRNLRSAIDKAEACGVMDARQRRWLYHVNKLGNEAKHEPNASGGGVPKGKGRGKRRQHR